MFLCVLCVSSSVFVCFLKYFEDLFSVYFIFLCVLCVSSSVFLCFFLYFEDLFSVYFIFLCVFVFIHMSCVAKQVIQLVRDGFGGDGKHPEGLRVELLKLAALLIEFMPKELMDHRKDLIKFAWNNIKVDKRSLF